MNVCSYMGWKKYVRFYLNLLLSYFEKCEFGDYTRLLYFYRVCKL
jgi:hypothetical protein